jgi:subtilisin family serine protease
VRISLEDEHIASLTGRGVKIAVLDSGIHAAHPHVGGIDGGISLVDGTNPDDLLDRVGHGTAVAAAIREKSPDARLLAVKIFDRRLATNADTLASALVWAADHGAAIINLSLGTRNAAHAGPLAIAVAHAVAAGALVISARTSDGADCWPGALNDVIGVVADADLDRRWCDVASSTQGAIVVRASPFPRPIPDVPPERNLSGVSFAVANVSGIVARLLEAANGEVGALRRRLEQAADSNAVESYRN